MVLLSDALDEGGQQNLQDDSGKVRAAECYSLSYRGGLRSGPQVW